MRDRQTNERTEGQKDEGITRYEDMTPPPAIVWPDRGINFEQKLKTKIDELEERQEVKPTGQNPLGRKGKGLDTRYSAAYMSQTRDQQRFTISEVAADLHKRMVRQRALCGHPSPALTDNWTHGAASRHTIAPISHTRPVIVTTLLVSQDRTRRGFFL